MMRRGGAYHGCLVLTCDNLGCACHEVRINTIEEVGVTRPQQPPLRCPRCASELRFLAFGGEWDEAFRIAARLKNCYPRGGWPSIAPMPMKVHTLSTSARRIHQSQRGVRQAIAPISQAALPRPDDLPVTPGD